MDFEGAFFNTSDYELTNNRLGEGAFGKVYIVERISDHKQFAAKMINPKGMLNGNDQINFLRESLILKRLNHPAIVHFYGINFHSFGDTSTLEPTILTEYLAKGSLQSVLDAERKGSCDKKWNDTKKYICLLGIANAMQYLHANGVLHRDLKCLNVLIDDNFYPRVCDFGLSRCFSEELSNTIQISMTGAVGSPFYMAPELIESEKKYGAKIDVYAFAIVAYEIVTGLIPYSHIPKLAVFKLFKSVLKGDRPRFNDKVSDKMKDLIIKCWSEDPSERPTFSQIFQLLSTDFTFSKEEVDEREVTAYIKSLKGTDFIEKSSKLSDLFFDCSRLTIINEIGRGGIGTFYKAVLPATDESPETEYTLKTIERIPNLDGQKEFLKSLEIQSSFRHPSVLPLIGFSLPTETEQTYSIVTPFMPNGSLENLIKKASLGDFPPNFETIRAVTIFGVAAGMCYIHQHNVLLGDLRTETVFFDGSYRPKIGGFSNAFFLRNGSSYSRGDWQKGIPGYMAPEVIEQLPFSNKIDVFAYALLVYRLMTLKFPYVEAKVKTSFALFKKVVSGVRPEIAEGELSGRMRRLVEECWRGEPEERPTFARIVREMVRERRAFFDREEIDQELLDEYIDEATRDLSI